MPQGPVLTVIITSATEGLDKGLKEAEGKLTGIAKAGGKLKSVAKVAAPIAAVGAAVAKLGAAGDKANTSVALFNEAMSKAGASAEDLAGPLKDAQTEAKNMAFSGGQARDALVSLQTATGDAAKSAELLAVAQDVARLSGADLTVAADAIAKAYTGQDRALRALIPGLDPAAKGIGAIAEAEKLAAGQADIFAGSAEAMGIKTKTAVKGIAVQVGKALAPALVAMLDALLPVVTAIGEMVTILMPVLEPALKAVAKIIEVVAKAFTKLLGLFNQFLSYTVNKLVTAFQKTADNIRKVVDVVQRLIDKFKALIEPINNVIGKLKDIDLNPFKKAQAAVSGAQAAAPSVGTFSAGVGTRSTGGVIINIYGDPSVIEAKVTKALRDYARRNGAAAVLTPGRT